MAIFELTTAMLDTADGIMEETNELADDTYDFLEVIAVTIDDAPEALKKLKNFLNTLIALVDSLIDSIGRNPLLKGPWKILANLFAGLLAGVKWTIKKVKGLVKATIRIFKDERIKELKEKVEEAQEKTTDLSEKINEVQAIMGFVYDLSNFLKEQQPDIEKVFPSLKTNVETNQLHHVYLELKQIEQKLKEINAKVDRIQAKADGIEKLIADVNALIAAGASVATAINNIMKSVADVFRAIKDFISSIPLVGWFMDALDSLIETAFDALGINDLLKRIGDGVSNLPFFAQVKDYLKKLKQEAKELKDQVVEMINDFIETIQKNELVEDLNTQILIIFSQLDIRKLSSEGIIPDWVQDILDLIEKIKKLIEEEGGEIPEAEVKKKYDELVVNIQNFSTFVNMNPDLIVNADKSLLVHENVKNILDGLDLSAANHENYREFEVVDSSIESISEKLAKTKTGFETLQKTISELNTSDAVHADDYFSNELSRVLGLPRGVRGVADWKLDLVPDKLREGLNR